MKNIFKCFGKLFKISFLSLFFIIGTGLLIIAYVIYINYSYFQNPPAIDDFSPGKVVKLSLIPDSNYIINSDYSNTPCVFSKTEYIRYYNSHTTDKNSSSRTTKRIEKTIIKPDYIVLKNKNDRYVLNFNDLKPRMFIDTELFFLKDKTTGKYNQTTAVNFSSGDEIIKESLILSDDNITVFGKLVNIKNSPEQNAKKLQFYGENFSPSLNNFVSIVKKLPDYLATNKLIFYILTTKNSADSQKDMNMSGFFFVGGLGLLFTLIPGIFILKIIFSLLINKSKLQTF